MESDEQQIITQDERLMAGLGHLSVLVPYAGFLAPLVLWITQKEKSRFVAYQALQAAALQVVMLLGWILGMGCYFLAFFSMIIMMPFVNEETWLGMPVAMFIAFLILMVMLLAEGLLALYGIIAAVQIFRGKNFRYILIGRMLDRYLSQTLRTEG